MATNRGRLGEVLIAATPGPATTPISEIRGIEYTREGTEEDTTIFGAQRISLTDLKVTGTMELYAEHFAGTDPAQNPGQALLNVNDVVALAFRPNGTGTGKPELSGNVKLTRENYSQEASGFWESSWDFEVDGADDWTRSVQA